MLLDTQCLFSDNQAITESAASDNVVKFGKGEITYLPLLIQVTEDFDTLTSLTIKIQTSLDEEFTNPVDLTSTTVVLADLKAGYIVPVNYFPMGNLGYIRIYYTVTGSNATAGKITAGAVCNIDTKM